MFKSIPLFLQRKKQILIQIIVALIVILTAFAMSTGCNNENGGEGDDLGIIVFSSKRDPHSLIFQVYSMKTDGTEVTRISDSVNDEEFPELSPDGSRIVCLDSTREEIITRNIDGSNRTVICTLFYCTQPSWSPDGNRILFIYNDGLDSEIAIMDTDGTNTSDLTDNAFYESYCYFSPDGSKIVFTSNQAPDPTLPEVYVMNADGSNHVRLTNNDVYDALPRYSPDGTKISYFSNPDLYIMDADGSNPKKIYTGIGTINIASEWTQDGSKIIFSDSDGTDFEIYSINPDGTGLINLTDNDDIDDSL